MNRGPEIRVSSLREHTSWRTRLLLYARLVRLDRPIGILLLLWPTLWALWIAGAGNPPWSVVLIFLLGVVLMRSAGCAINDFADRHFDGQVARTRHRPLAVGQIRPQEAVVVFLGLSLLAFSLVLLLNRLTVLMSVVAVSLAALYPFTKRYTHLPQLVLGAAFGWAVPMAFTAIQGTVPAVGWLLFVATVTWALIYDTEYAMVDRDDDLLIGVKSSAILFGRYDRLVIAGLQFAFVLMLLWIGRMADLGNYYLLGLAGAAAMSLRQQFLIRRREPQAYFKAFLNNNVLGMLIFLGLLLHYLTL